MTPLIPFLKRGTKREYKVEGKEKKKQEREREKTAFRNKLN
jgi:hypothetical protein